MARYLSIDQVLGEGIREEIDDLATAVIAHKQKEENILDFEQRYAKCNEIVDESYRSHPEHFATNWYKALLEETKGQFSEADKLWEKASELNPRSIDLARDWSSCLAYRGDLDKAIQIAETANNIPRRRNTPLERLLTELYFNAGHQALEGEDYPRAMEYARKGVEITSQYGKIEKFAHHLMAKGATAFADEFFRAAIKEAPKKEKKRIAENLPTYRWTPSFQGVTECGRPKFGAILMM